MRNTILQAFLVLLIFTLTAGAASATTIAAGSGTLTYTEKTTQETCTYGDIGTSGYEQFQYSAFSYTASGVTTPLGGIYYANTPAPKCEIAASWPTLGWDIFSTPVFPFTSQTGSAITFSTEYDTATATVTKLVPGILYPKYKVLSIVYAAPGDLSNDGYTNTLTDGTSTSVGSSFQAGDTVTFSYGFHFLGLGSTMSWSFGTAVTTGNDTEVTDTFSEAQGVSNDSNSGASNAINHGNDMIILWVNPALVVYQTGATAAGYAQGTQLQTTGDPQPGQPEAIDSLEVYAGVMKANASGVTTVPAAILNAQTVSVAGETGSQTLPGLGSICASHPYYPTSCTLANQCGCVPADFAGILAADPLFTFANTESPLNANTSSNPERFVEVTGAELLAGPEQKGGNNPINSFTESDSTETAETWTYSLQYTVGYSWEVSWQVEDNGPKLASATQFQWTNTDSVGESNGSAHEEAVSLSSNTVGCYEDVSIFEDTVFHTFAFQQPAGNTSCP
jgi:hypothetical protein